MWPQLFGAGSELGLLVAGGMLVGFAAIVWYAMRTPRPMGPDPLADLWRAYEQGTMTSWEAARLLRILAAGQEAAEPAGRGAAELPRCTGVGPRLTDALAAVHAVARNTDRGGV